MNTGALHCSPARQLITPLPYSPPKMNAAFFSPGITTTQRALCPVFLRNLAAECPGRPRAAAASRVASLRRIARAVRRHRQHAPTADADDTCFICHLVGSDRCNAAATATRLGLARRRYHSADMPPRKKAGPPEESGAGVGRPHRRPKRARPAAPRSTASPHSVEADGGAVLGRYSDPFGGTPLLLAALPVDRVEPTPYQRDPSDAHVKRLMGVIENDRPLPRSDRRRCATTGST